MHLLNTINLWMICRCLFNGFRHKITSRIWFRVPQHFMTFSILFRFRRFLGSCWHPFGSILVALGTLLVQFGSFWHQNPPFRHPNAQNTCRQPQTPSSKQFYFPRPRAEICRRQLRLTDICIYKYIT